MIRWVRALSLVAVAAAFLTAGMAAAPPASGTAAKLDVKTIRLDNGLRIYVLERTASPTFAGLYQFDVGGAMDPKGRSGIAHLLEHMMFKGTKTVGITDAAKESPLMDRLRRLWDELQRELDKGDDPFAVKDPGKIDGLKRQIEEVTAQQKALILKNEFDQVMTRAGGVGMNASTGQDATNYYIQMPANRLELWFRMESDRLLNPVFREFWSERDVVAEERRLRTENSPFGMANEALMSLMFPAHPYGTPVVGWPADIARLSHDDAMAYFRTYYSPSNCVMVLVGDVRTADVERLAKKYFGPWQRQEIPPRVATAEPEPRGERRRVVEFDAEPTLRMGWPTVPEGHADDYALQVLGAVLGGLDSSRLDKTIVQKERIASSVSAGQAGLARGGFFSVSATPRGDRSLAEIEAAIDREIASIQERGITGEELSRAKVRVETSRVASLKSNIGLAFRIADAVTTSGGLDYIDEYERRMNAVTSEDVQRVAKTYLQGNRRSLVEVRKTPGAAVATRGGDSGHGRGASDGARGAAQSKGLAAAMQMIRSAPKVELRVPEIGKDIERVELPSGPIVFIKEDHSAPTVEMGLSWLGGSNTTPVEDLAPFSLASQLMNEGGTETLTPDQLDERKEDLGMSFSVWFGATESGGSFWSLRRNFDASFALALDVLMKPRFDAERLETIRGQFVERMKRRQDSPGSGVAVLQNWLINGTHPRLGYVPAKAEIDAVSAEDIRGIWTRYLGRDNLRVSVVGDFDKKEMLAKLEAAFAGWRKAESSERVWITREPVRKPGAFLVEKALPQPAIRLIHQAAVDRTAPLADHAAVEILNDILGGSGFRSRLVERLRSDEGLTYGISSFFGHQGRPGVPGTFGVSYQTKAASVARSIASVLEEVGKIVAKPVSEEEIAEQKDAWRNRFIFRYTNDFSVVNNLMGLELDDRPYDFDRQMLDAVEKIGVADVERAAKRYLVPEALTIAIFGSPTPEEQAILKERHALEVVPRETVFTGGYDAPAPAKPQPEGAGAH